MLQVHSPDVAIALVGAPPPGSFPLLHPPLRTALGLRAGIFEGIAIEEAARHRNVVHVPLGIGARPEQFSADGFHPSPATYALLGEHIAAKMAPLLGQIQYSSLDDRSYAGWVERSDTHHGR